MNKHEDKPVDDLIESAMTRLKQSKENGARTGETTIGRRDYDQALAQRLAQLEQSGHFTPPKAPLIPAPTPPTDHQHWHNHHPAAMLAVTALVSALFGATLTWLVIGNKPQAMLLPNPTAVRAPLPGTPATPPGPPNSPAANPSPAPIAQTEQAAAVTATQASTPAAPSPASPAPAPAPALSAAQEIATLIEAWRHAWSARDAEAYLSFYSPDFSPADGQKRSSWAEARRKNLSSRPNIDVAVNDLEIEPLSENKAKASFLQDYAAGKLRETGQPKTLLLVRQDGEWLIAGEWQGKQVPNISQ